MDSRSGLTPAEQIQAICKAVPALYKQRDKIVSQLGKAPAGLQHLRSEAR